jgi:carbamoyl-phosphate synthase small subunit
MARTLKQATLSLKNGTAFKGFSFGFPRSVAGEAVFNTGMVGYVETLTDPSYAGQILVLTYPIVGSYGVPRTPFFESQRIQASGVVVAEHVLAYSHHDATRSLHEWLHAERVPGLFGVDTREITKMLRESGVMLGRILVEGEKPAPWRDPDTENLAALVSVGKAKRYVPKGTAKKRIVALDCGVKENSIRSFLARGVEVLRVPWNHDFLAEDFDGLFISNGPGNPAMYGESIALVREVMRMKKPIFGICLGTQLMALAAGASTYKLKYGHRSQNQPVKEAGTGRCFVTSQNHGFAVDEKTLPRRWHPWFTNLNDGTLEGVRHDTSRWFSVQFHPEAAPGPTDTDYLFDQFVKEL